MALVEDTVLFLGSAVIAVPVFKRLGFGSLLGYLAAGIAIGPGLFGLVSDVDAILHFAEFGVVLLLFLIGLELHPSRLWALRRPILGLGASQVLLSAAAIAGAAWLAGQRTQTAVVIGLVLALSSTAFALQTLSERRELRTQQGRAAFSILLFQDLAVIPLLAILPWIAGASIATVADGAARLTGTDWLAIGFSVAAVAVAVVGGRYVLRPFLKLVAAADVPELFTAAALLVVLGMALLMEKIGLSTALGAFLAGVLLADSQYRHQLEGDIEPFKGLLLGLFFIAVGMSMDLGLLAEEPVAILGVAVGLMAIKLVVLLVLGLAVGMRWDAALALAAVLPQGGEFAFVLFGQATSVGAVDRPIADFLIMAVAVSMALTPLSVALADRVRHALRNGDDAAAAPLPEVDEHDPRVVIAGFGRFGQIVGRVLNVRRIKFVALDSDNARIEVARRFGNLAYFGDANRLQVLEAAGTGKAEIFVIAVDNPDRAVEIARMVRMHFPGIRVYARAADRFHAYRLMEVGVDAVFREMFGSSIDMAKAVFIGLGMPYRRADEITRTFKEHDETLVREQYRLQGDESAIIQSTREAASHLAGLFEHDRELSGDDADGSREAAE
ncbi:potassium transporter [Thalassobaculum fulvum]|uniref:Potassium transporter n=1 Tax=Thalassobaculum fulvum TaxID=1633335 RepID=A0A918XUJ8_9PROT|nr:monovalent cation:proton antiporter-2 (CPA2) family protein [Thalassobaculum fulvum]GHD53808.1 potassium transporter [Thalassobaculum fulvum]